MPEVVFSLPHLGVLCLRNNAIKELSPGIRRLAGSLTELELRKNFLAGLPDEIGELRQLKLLSIGRNTLYRLPESIGQLGGSLSNLWLEHNRLRALPEGICKLDLLEDLNLFDNKLSSLPAAFGDLVCVHTDATTTTCTSHAHVCRCLVLHAHAHARTIKLTGHNRPCSLNLTRRSGTSGSFLWAATHSRPYRHLCSRCARLRRSTCSTTS